MKIIKALISLILYCSSLLKKKNFKNEFHLVQFRLQVIILKKLNTMTFSCSVEIVSFSKPLFKESMLKNAANFATHDGQQTWPFYC